MDVATLSVAVDTTDLKAGGAELDKFAAKGKKAEASTKSVGSGLSKGSTALKEYSTSVKSATGHTANLTAQFNDIGVMLAAGQSPLQLAMQQGTQINQVFAQMGGGRQALHGVAAGFASMVSPINLATIGIIAGGAALVQWGISATGAADDGEALEDAISSMNDGLSTFNGIADLAKSSLDDLRDKYGENAESVRELARELLALGRQQAMAGFNEAIRATGDTLTGLTVTLGEFAAARRALLQAQDGEGNLLPSEIAILEGDMAAALGELESKFGLTSAQAYRVKDALDAINTAATDQAKATAVQGLASALASAANEGAQLPPELIAAAQAAQQAYNGLQEVDAAAGGVTSRLIDAANAARQLASAIASAAGMSANLDNGVVILEAEISALKAGADASIARTITSMKLKAEESRQKQIAAGQDKIIADAQYGIDMATIGRQEELLAQKAALVKANSEVAKSGGGGGGGGGGASGARQAQAEYNSLMREADQLFQSTRTSAELYQMELDGIQTLLDGGFISQDTYNRAIEQAAEKYREAADAGKFFQDQAMGLVDGLIDAAISGGSLSDVFANLAKQIAKAALQAALFGQGPMAGLFGQTPGFGLLSGLFPMHADGTDNAPGGLSIVGEEGPEIVNLPKGSQVFSNSDSKRMAESMGRMGSQVSSPVQMNTKILNVLDPALVGDFLATADGEKLVTNIIRRNLDVINA